MRHQTTRGVNEALARLAAKHPQRVSALGTVPLQDPDLAARELGRVMRLPGIAGVEVTASVRGTYLGDDRFRPFRAAAEDSGALVLIHPTTRGFDLPVFNALGIAAHDEAAVLGGNAARLLGLGS